jgi:hypothetical protein
VRVPERLERGTVWAWGDNDHGQLGDGTTVGKLVPNQVQVLTNVTAIAAGWFSMALNTDATLWSSSLALKPGKPPRDPLRLADAEPRRPPRLRRPASVPRASLFM